MGNLDVPSKTLVFGVFLRFKPDKGFTMPTIVPTTRQVYLPILIFVIINLK